MAALSTPGTRVLLLGTGTHSEASGLPPIPAVAGTLTDLDQVLIERCGLPEEDVRIVRDPATSIEMGLAIAEEAERAEGVLWVHFVGHGLVSPAGELYLATTATDPRPSRLAPTALAYTAVRDCLLQTPTRSIVVVLDCCFSGRAIGTLGGGQEPEETELARVHGGFVLAAAAGDQLALAVPGAAHTAFSGELIRLLIEGDPEGPPMLTLRYASRYLDRTLPSRGYPRPRRRASEWIDDLVLCPNPAYRPPSATAASDTYAPPPGDDHPLDQAPPPEGNEEARSGTTQHTAAHRGRTGVDSEGRGRPPCVRAERPRRRGQRTIEGGAVTRSVIRRVNRTCALDRSDGAPQGLLHQFQCTSCGETGECSEDFETARDFTFHHIGHNPRHTSYREVVHGFWRMHADG